MTSKHPSQPAAKGGLGDLSLQPEDLQKCSWDQLLEMFSSALKEHEQLDKDLQHQTMELLKVFEIWTQVTVSRDEDRSYKRFQTRMQHVQNSERELEEKKEHYPFPGVENSRALGPAATPRSKLDSLSTGSLFAEDDIIAPEALLDGDAIEDLLASLGGGNNEISEDTGTQLEDRPGIEESQTRDLLDNVYGFIQQTSTTEPESNIDISPQASLKRRKEDDIPDFLKDIDSSEDESDSDEEKEEAEAAKYVENLLKEIAENPPPTSPPEDSSTPPPKEDVDGDEDNLSFRLAALSLPSAPNTTPGDRPKRNNDETPDCCCICYDTAKLKCLDCEGDQLFCVRCWWEMHMDGDGDSGHKAVKFKGWS
ncbi:Hypothetical protein PENO1_083070 [Penicillium occitanis (nom. inval.)]|nr:Hypothetical protein PENO1_083070 [Penicillium occitanis (nom. inval.)]PCG93830.1 hypothetical protein PENOC_085800 [Penicillium occitanis (nom. inval.)]